MCFGYFSELDKFGGIPGILSSNLIVVIIRKIYKPLFSSKYMVLQDISNMKKPLLKLENPEKTWNSSDRGLQRTGKEKLNILKKEVVEMNSMINSREKLSSQIFNEAEKIKIDIGNFLANKDVDDEDAIRERNGLRQKQVEICELQLKEKVNCWQDIARLKQELRERERELADREGRVEMLDSLLGEEK